MVLDQQLHNVAHDMAMKHNTQLGDMQLCSMILPLA